MTVTAVNENPGRDKPGKKVKKTPGRPRRAKSEQERPRRNPGTGPWPPLMTSEAVAARLGVPQYLTDVLTVAYDIPRGRIGNARLLDADGQARLRDAVARFQESRKRLREAETLLSR